MIGPLMNPNVIPVPSIRKGCAQLEFSSSYPVRLNGIINLEEYQQSIANINRALIPDKRLIISSVIAGIALLAALICLMLFGVIMASINYQYVFVFLGISGGVFLISGLALTMSLYLFQSKRISQMYQAISQESAKYCQRSPMPCSWRASNRSPLMGNFYPGISILIEIGNPFPSSQAHRVYHYNQVAPQWTPAFTPFNQVAAQPPTYDQIAVQFCARCGTAKVNSLGAYCSSCGHAFLKC